MKMKVTACLVLLACLAGTANAGSTRQMGDFTLSGYVDGQFMAQQANKGGVPGGDTEWKSSFGDNSHMVLWAQSDDSQTASFVSEMYYWQATNAVTVQQAAIDWHLYKTDAYRVTGRMGKFYYPFGIEARSVYATTNKLVSRPYIMAWAETASSSPAAARWARATCPSTGISPRPTAAPARGWPRRTPRGPTPRASAGG